MNWSNPVLKAAVIGAGQGAAASAILFATSSKYTLANDWFLGVMIVFANATGFAVAALFGLNLLGVALAGLAGMVVGGELGTRLIGSYEYNVPVPPEEREWRIIAGGKERVVPVPGMSAERVKRIPVGGGIGVVVGWAAGVVLYAWLLRPRDEEVTSDTTGATPPAP